MAEKKKMARTSLVLVALGLAFVMCAGSIGSFVVSANAPPKNVQPRLDNYLYVGMQDEPKSLNPVIPNDVWSSNFLGWMWDGTLSRDPDDQSLQPWIATDWHMIQDGTNKNFTIHYRFDKWQYVYTDDAHTNLVKKEIKFHDGHEVTIYDLLFTIELAMKVPRWSSGYESLDKTPNGTVIPPGDGDAAHAIHLVRGVSMDASPSLDQYTLHFFLNRTDASWELNYVGMVLYPYHLWKDKFYSGQFNTWNIENEGNPGQYEVGSGPFKYNKWTKGGQFAQLDTFVDYFPWNKMPRDSTGAVPPALAGTDWHWEVKKSPITVDPSQQLWGKRLARPYIDGVKYRIYYSVDTAVLAMQSGDVDVNWWTVDPGYIPQLQGNKNIQLVSSEDTGFFYAAFNMRKEAFGYNDWNSPTREDKGKAFRQAFTMCTDKDSIVKRLLMNYGVVGGSVISPSNTEWHNPSVPVTPFDPAGAEKILDDAGHGVDGTGWRDLGPPVGSSKFFLIHPTKDYDSIRYEAARMVVDQLQKIKVNIESKPLQFGQIVELMNARNFDVYVLGWRLGLEPDYMYDFFASSQAGPGLNNHPGYHNDAYDALVEKSRSELNRATRRDEVRQAQAIIAGDLPYDVLYYRSNIEAYRKDRWAGWVKTTGGIMNGWSFNFIQKPKEYMNVEVSTPPLVVSENTISVTVTVKDSKTLAPVSGALVSTLITAPGALSPGTLDGAAISNKTSGLDGTVVYTYKAPLVNSVEKNRTATFDCTATKTGYEVSKDFATIQVIAQDYKILKAVIDTAGSTLKVKEGNTGTLKIKVLDQNDLPVSGAYVTLIVDPASGLTLAKTNATSDSSGRASVTFTGNAKDNKATSFNITATPVKTGDVNLVFSDKAMATILPGDGGTPTGDNTMIIVALVVVVVVVIAVVAVAVIRKKRSI